MTITYELNNSLYLNLTNACSCNCTFCERNNADGINPGESLWLEREPTREEILEALSNVNFEKYKEIVFCGYGEPTMRLDTLLEIGRYLKKNQNLPIRLNTNGLSDLVNHKKTASLLAECIDHVSISLNAPNAKAYYHMCVPAYGEGSFDALIQFAKDCKEYIKEVTLSIVGHTLDKKSIEECQALSDSLGITLRIR